MRTSPSSATCIAVPLGTVKDVGGGLGGSSEGSFSGRCVNVGEVISSEESGRGGFVSCAGSGPAQKHHTTAANHPDAPKRFISRRFLEKRTPSLATQPMRPLGNRRPSDNCTDHP